MLLNYDLLGKKDIIRFYYFFQGITRITNWPTAARNSTSVQSVAKPSIRSITSRFTCTRITIRSPSHAGSAGKASVGTLTWKSTYGNCTITPFYPAQTILPEDTKTETRPVCDWTWTSDEPAQPEQQDLCCGALSSSTDMNEDKRDWRKSSHHRGIVHKTESNII